MAVNSSSANTPNGGPVGNIVGITQAQKQALIDNLQLEVTERARKLRAQYALQAQGLRNRIELRINRIPKSLRNANIGKLHAKYIEIKKKIPKDNTMLDAEKPRIDLALNIGKKRPSDFTDDADKENAPNPTESISPPKKRIKHPARPGTHTEPSISTVLSPKSSNSRTLPQSPLQPIISIPLASPLKAIVPIKQSSPTKSATTAPTASLAGLVAEKTKNTRTKPVTERKASQQKPTVKPANTRPKRGIANAPAEKRVVSNISSISNVSTGTTVIKKGGRAAITTKAVESKKKVATTSSARAIGKKTVSTVEAPAAGKRVLRKRA